MKKTHKIVMLPTDDVAPLAKWDGKFIIDKEGIDSHIMPTYHLHLLSDDEIKSGDWVYNFYTERVWQFTRGEVKCKIADTWKGIKKIIATTDPKLTKVDEVSGDNVWTSPIPQIPQSLIEYYTKHQPEEVELEYFTIEEHPNRDSWYLDTDENNEVVWVEPEIEKFKNAYNKANNLYSREEVQELIEKVLVDFDTEEYTTQYNRGVGITKNRMFPLQGWLKKNL